MLCCIAWNEIDVLFWRVIHLILLGYVESAVTNDTWPWLMITIFLLSGFSRCPSILMSPHSKLCYMIWTIPLFTFKMGLGLRFIKIN